MAGVEVQYRPGSQPSRATAAAWRRSRFDYALRLDRSPSARVALARDVPGCQRCHHGRHTPTRPIGIAIVPYPLRDAVFPPLSLSSRPATELWYERGITGLVLIASAVLAGVVGFSYLVEALRPAPTIPTRLPWGRRLKSAP